MAFPDTTPSRAQVHPVLWLMAGAMVLIEAMFVLADLEVLPAEFQRWRFYVPFAFHDRVLESTLRTGQIHPQLIWSLITYAFLHGGLLHLVLNLAVFLALGHAIVQSTGVWAMLALFCVSAIAGALAMGFMADTQAPLVGASGAIFGFLGAFTAWQERLLARNGRSRVQIWKRLFGLAALNVLLAVAVPIIAWEAHAGGFVMGWIFALICPASGLMLRREPPADGPPLTEQK